METERDLGPQPIADRMRECNLAPTDLVQASTEQLSFKMVSRALKGRRLTPNTMRKVHRALNAASAQSFEITDLFNYALAKPRPEAAPPE